MITSGPMMTNSSELRGAIVYLSGFSLIENDQTSCQDASYGFKEAGLDSFSIVNSEFGLDPFPPST